MDFELVVVIALICNVICLLGISAQLYVLGKAIESVGEILTISSEYDEMEEDAEDEWDETLE